MSDKFIVTCTHCKKSWDKSLLDRSCSNCFACTGCEAYICPECRYEIIVTSPKPMKRSSDTRDLKQQNPTA